MTIRGYNVYLGGVKVNDTLISGPPFTIDGIASDTDYGVTLTAVDAAGNESAPSTVFTASTLAVPNTGGPLSTADRNAVDAIVAEQMAISKVPGVMISMVGPRGSYTRAYGKIGSGAGDRALTTDDHFRIGSSSKLFTGYAVFRCIDQGLLSLDDKLADFVDGIPNGDIITVRMMLMMRSGVNVEQTDFSFLLRTVMSPSRPYPAKSWLAIEKKKAMSPPDTKWQYTNANYFLLGLVVEAVTGRNIRDVITEDIIVPLGLTETSWPPDAKIPAPFSKGYYNNPLAGIPFIGGAAVKEITEFHPDYTQGAGAIVTTIGDFQKFAIELRDGTLLSAESHSAREDVWGPFDPQFIIDPKHYTKPSQLRYGLGMYSYGTWVGHPGSMPGFQAYCYYDMDSGAAMAGMENSQATDSSIFANIWPRIADLLYPGSMEDRDYSGNTVRPLPATVTLTTGRPSVTVDMPGVLRPVPALVTVTGGTPTVRQTDNKYVTPTGAVVTILTGTPGAAPNVAQPTPATVTVTGGTPNVVVTSFTPFSEENLDRIDRAVPIGATEWRWVGVGGGGGGGGGLYASGSTAMRRGGSGGGGAAKIDTGWQSVALLGPTYSNTRGSGGTGGVSASTGSGGGTDGVSGSHSTFTSGSVSLSASRGGTATGADGSAFGLRGGGGTVVVTGVTPALAANGTAGGSPVIAPPNNTAGGAAGGSAGLGSRGTGSSTISVPGGSTATAAGAALGTDGADQAAGDPGPGGGGNGGNGGNFGGGGGGAYSAVNGSVAGDGGDGYTYLEFR